jgi:nucleotide-binding universal stress UspA family protein
VADPRGEGSAALVAKLRALVPEWAMRYGIVTHAEVVHRANASEAIRAAAARIGADVICMASHGRRGLRRAVLGSVAEDVVRNASGAVMIVRPPEP